MTYVSKAPSELCKDLMPTSVGSFTDLSNPWRLMVGKMIDEPSQQIGFYDTPGQSPDPKWLLDYPSVQVIVRGPAGGYKPAWDKMREVYDVLLGADPRQNANGDWVDAITVLANPSISGYDVRDRPTISGNFRLIVRPAASTLTHREVL